MPDKTYNAGPAAFQDAYTLGSAHHADLTAKAAEIKRAAAHHDHSPDEPNHHHKGSGPALSLYHDREPRKSDDESKAEH